MRECSPSTTCHMSCVTCHMSCVMCHMSHVICQVPQLKKNMVFLQKVGARRWRVCYQVRLLRLRYFLYLVATDSSFLNSEERWRRWGRCWADKGADPQQADSWGTHSHRLKDLWTFLHAYMLHEGVKKSLEYDFMNELKGRLF